MSRDEPIVKNDRQNVSDRDWKKMLFASFQDIKIRFVPEPNDFGIRFSNVLTKLRLCY